MTETNRRGKCSEALNELYAYLDGEVTAERKSHIEAHLNGCNPCLEAFDFQAELRLVIAQKCRDEVPPSLLERIIKLIDEPAEGTSA
jgi:mycothiol system anti-sigma-R factor